jgi:hypothetical protein
MEIKRTADDMKPCHAEFHKWLKANTNHGAKEIWQAGWKAAQQHRLPADNEQALLAAERAYHDHIEGRPMMDAIKAYLDHIADMSKKVGK